MPTGRHRKTTRWPVPRLAAAAGVAVTVTMAVPVAVAAVTHLPSADEPQAQSARKQPAAEAVRANLRASRSGDRPGLSMLVLPSPKPLVTETEPAVQLKPRWTTTRLNVWSGPGEDSKLLKVLDAAVRCRSPEVKRARGPRSSTDDKTLGTQGVPRPSQEKLEALTGSCAGRRDGFTLSRRLVRREWSPGEHR